MTRFLLIRHATTDANGVRLAGRMAGVHLNRLGRRQAQRLAERLARENIAAIYSSPLERAMETAEPMGRLLGREVVLRENLIEIEFGEWTNRTFEELASQTGFARFNDFRSCAPIPGGEFMLPAQTRMIGELAELRSRHPDEAVVVVGHGDMIRSAIAYYAGISLDMFQRIEISPASISVVDIDQAAVRIVSLNDTGGLDVTD